MHLFRSVLAHVGKHKTKIIFDDDVAKDLL